MVDRVCELPSCVATFRAKPAEVAKGAGRFCSRVHAYAAHRLERPEHACAHCGKPSGLRAADIKRGRKYCGWGCYEAAHRVHHRPAELPCERCGKLYPTSGRAAVTRFCSSRCFGDSLRRVGAPPPCAQCGKPRQWEYGTSVNSVGPYCSKACAGLARRSRRIVTCLACGKPFERRHAELSNRRDLHCSRACRNLTAERRASYVVCSRPGCRVKRRVHPSTIAAGLGKYCSRVCWLLVHAKHRFRCAACKTVFEAPAWRKPTYCSLACTNRGRVRVRRPELVVRDRLILELHGQGLTSPTIAEHLAQGSPSWSVPVPAATIRSVIARAYSEVS